MRILLAVDGSTFSDEAVKEVARRPWPTGSEVKVISVVEPLYVTPEPWVGMEEYYREMDEAAKKAAGLATEGAASMLRTGEDRSLKISTETLFGSAKKEILDEAERWGGRLNRRGLARLRLLEQSVPRLGFAHGRHARQMLG